MPEQSSYGWFHILSFVLMLAFAVFICVRFANCSDKTLRKITLITFVTLVVLDVYKQITYDWVEFDAALGEFVWDYSWYSFPFQLCSTPHYVLPFIIWLKDGKVRDAFIGYMCFFSFVGGAAVFFYPETCLTSFIGVNIQTMVHHGMQVVLGVFYAVNQRKKFNNAYFLRTLPVFVGFLGVAMVLNFAVQHAIWAGGGDDVFNMFYISPYHTSLIPVLDEISSSMPYPVLFFTYFFGLIAIAYAVFSVMRAAIRYHEKKKLKSE